MTKKERFRQWAVRPDSSHASGEVAASEFNGRTRSDRRPRAPEKGGRAEPFSLPALTRIHQVAAPELCR